MRFEKTKLESYDRPTHRYEYYVTGRGEFPLDMLRYDRASPKRSVDVDQINWRENEMRSILLVSYQQPVVDRWSSFGWSVGDALVTIR